MPDTSTLNMLRRKYATGAPAPQGPAGDSFSVSPTVSLGENVPSGNNQVPISSELPPPPPQHLRLEPSFPDSSAFVSTYGARMTSTDTKALDYSSRELAQNRMRWDYAQEQERLAFARLNRRASQQGNDDRENIDLRIPLQASMSPDEDVVVPQIEPLRATIPSDPAVTVQRVAQSTSIPSETVQIAHVGHDESPQMLVAAQIDGDSVSTLHQLVASPISDSLHDHELRVAAESDSSIGPHTVMTRIDYGESEPPQLLDTVVTRTEITPQPQQATAITERASLQPRGLPPQVPVPVSRQSVQQDTWESLVVQPQRGTMHVQEGTTLRIPETPDASLRIEPRETAWQSGIATASYARPIAESDLAISHLEVHGDQPERSLPPMPELRTMRENRRPSTTPPSLRPVGTNTEVAPVLTRPEAEIPLTRPEIIHEPKRMSIPAPEAMYSGVSVQNVPETPSVPVTHQVTETVVIPVASEPAPAISDQRATPDTPPRAPRVDDIAPLRVERVHHPIHNEPAPDPSLSQAWAVPQHIQEPVEPQQEVLRPVAVYTRDTTGPSPLVLRPTAEVHATKAQSSDSRSFVYAVQDTEPAHPAPPPLDSTDSQACLRPVQEQTPTGLADSSSQQSVTFLAANQSAPLDSTSSQPSLTATQLAVTLDRTVPPQVPQSDETVEALIRRVLRETGVEDTESPRELRLSELREPSQQDAQEHVAQQDHEDPDALTQRHSATRECGRPHHQSARERQLRDFWDQCSSGPSDEVLQAIVSSTPSDVSVTRVVLDQPLPFVSAEAPLQPVTARFEPPTPAPPAKRLAQQSGTQTLSSQSTVPPVLGPQFSSGLQQQHNSWPSVLSVNTKHIELPEPPACEELVARFSPGPAPEDSPQPPPLEPVLTLVRETHPLPEPELLNPIESLDQSRLRGAYDDFPWDPIVAARVAIERSENLLRQTQSLSYDTERGVAEEPTVQQSVHSLSPDDRALVDQYRDSPDTSMAQDNASRSRPEAPHSPAAQVVLQQPSPLLSPSNEEQDRSFDLPPESVPKPAPPTPEMVREARQACSQSPGDCPFVVACSRVEFGQVRALDSYSPLRTTDDPTYITEKVLLVNRGDTPIVAHMVSPSTPAHNRPFSVQHTTVLIPPGRAVALPVTFHAPHSGHYEGALVIKAYLATGGRPDISHPWAACVRLSGTGY